MGGPGEADEVAEDEVNDLWSEWALGSSRGICGGIGGRLEGSGGIVGTGGKFFVDPIRRIVLEATVEWDLVRRIVRTVSEPASWLFEGPSM